MEGSAIETLCPQYPPLRSLDCSFSRPLWSEGRGCGGGAPTVGSCRGRRVRWWGALVGWCGLSVVRARRSHAAPGGRRRRVGPDDALRPGLAQRITSGALRRAKRAAPRGGVLWSTGRRRDHTVSRPRHRDRPGQWVPSPTCGRHEPRSDGARAVSRSSRLSVRNCRACARSRTASTFASVYLRVHGGTRRYTEQHPHRSDEGPRVAGGVDQVTLVAGREHGSRGGQDRRDRPGRRLPGPGTPDVDRPACGTTGPAPADRRGTGEEVRACGAGVPPGGPGQPRGQARRGRDRGPPRRPRAGPDAPGPHGPRVRRGRGGRAGVRTPRPAGRAAGATAVRRRA